MLKYIGYLAGAALFGLFYGDYKAAVESDLLFGLGVLAYVAALVALVRLVARVVSSRHDA